MLKLHVPFQRVRLSATVACKNHPIKVCLEEPPKNLTLQIIISCNGDLYFPPLSPFPLRASPPSAAQVLAAAAAWHHPLPASHGPNRHRPTFSPVVGRPRRTRRPRRPHPRCAASQARPVLPVPALPRPCAAPSPPPCADCRACPRA
jgi:hypothetical protein